MEKKVLSQTLVRMIIFTERNEIETNAYCCHNIQHVT